MPRVERGGLQFQEVSKAEKEACKQASGLYILSQLSGNRKHSLGENGRGEGRRHLFIHRLAQFRCELAIMDYVSQPETTSQRGRRAAMEAALFSQLGGARERKRQHGPQLPHPSNLAVCAGGREMD